MTRRRSTAFRILLRLPLLLFMGNLSQCPFFPSDDLTPPTLTCSVPEVRIDRGACAELANPCDAEGWVEFDTFYLENGPEELFLQTERDPRRRFLCADSRIEPLDNAPIAFDYRRPGPERGVGTLRVTVGAEPLTVAASAVPATIAAGESSQLHAAVSGGVAPFRYSWVPPFDLSDATIQAPVAAPDASTQYTVTVTDSLGRQAESTVVVNVGLAAIATASPATIAAGEASQLAVQVSGGTPPYTFAWTPPDGLSAADSAAPIATPMATTAYTVTVTDFSGATAVALVTVSVTTGPRACMTLTTFSALAAQGDASCSIGDIVEYRWWREFLGPGEPPTAVTFAPLSPIFRYESPGPHVVRLEVADASGRTSATTVTHNP
jgi:hypothetical protein